MMKQVEDLLKEMRDSAYAKGYAQGRFDAEIERTYGKADCQSLGARRPESPREARDRIIDDSREQDD